MQVTDGLRAVFVRVAGTRHVVAAVDLHHRLQDAIVLDDAGVAQIDDERMVGRCGTAPGHAEQADTTVVVLAAVDKFGESDQRSRSRRL